MAILNDRTSHAGIALIVLGTFAVLIAAVASFNNVEKSFGVKDYLNTHWITSIILFAGCAHLFSIGHGSFHAEIFSFVINFLSFGICVTAAFADVVNLYSLPNDEYFLKNGVKADRTHLVMYGSADLVVSSISAVLSAFLLKGLLKSECNLPIQSRSPRLLVLGTIVIVVSSSALFGYVWEIVRPSGTHRTAFTHTYITYTCDELSWLVIRLMLGVLIILSSNGSMFLQSACLCLTGTSVLPSVFLLWLDYRLFSHNSAVSDANPIGTISVLLKFLAVPLLLVAFLYYIKKHYNSQPIRLERSVANVFNVLSALFLFVACATVAMDLYGRATNKFYRYFMASEQRAPFLAALASVFTILSANPNHSVFALPAALTISILAINSTFFQLISYVYLSFNGYFFRETCERLPGFENLDCKNPNADQGSTEHFVEAMLNFMLFALSSFTVLMVLRIAVLRSQSNDDGGKHKKYEKIALFIGVVMASCALFLLCTTLFASYVAIKRSADAFLVIYGGLFHVSLAIGLVIFSLFQIIVAESLSSQPLLRTSLGMVSIVRFVSILAELDYRLTGDDFDFHWLVHHTSDVLTLGCNFATVVLIIVMSTSRSDEFLPPNFDDLQFDNPLSNDREDNGYLQLRAEEQI